MSAGGGPFPRLMILNVNDRAEALYTASAMLRALGFGVYEATTAAEALAQATSMLPHAVVLDVLLPDGDGFDVCRRLKSDPRTAHIPILLVSGAVLGLDRTAQGSRRGADGFLQQPFSKTDLDGALRGMFSKVAQRTAEMGGDPPLFNARSARVREQTRALVEQSRKAVEAARRMNDEIALADEEPGSGRNGGERA